MNTVCTSRHTKFADDSRMVALVIPRCLHDRIARFGGNKSARMRKYMADGVERDEREEARIKARQGD